MLKGTRCETAKCPMERQDRSLPPGQSKSVRRGQASEYGKRLRETQKVKRYYGLFDRQFRRYFERAQHSPENTGQALLMLLERRFDNVICKLGFAPSRKAARELITHKHFTINGKYVTKPGYLVSVLEKISVREKESSRNMVRAWVEADPNRPIQPWLKLDVPNLTAGVVALPTRDDVQIPVEEQLIVEFCSR